MRLSSAARLDRVGIELTQLAYLAYGDREVARARRVMAPNTPIREYDWLTPFREASHRAHCVFAQFCRLYGEPPVEIPHGSQSGGRTRSRTLDSVGDALFRRFLGSSEDGGQRRVMGGNASHGGHADHRGESHRHGEESDGESDVFSDWSEVQRKDATDDEDGECDDGCVSERIENDEKRKNMGPAAAGGGYRLGQNREPSKNIRAADDEEMRGIVAFFGPIRRVPARTGPMHKRDASR